MDFNMTNKYNAKRVNYDIHSFASQLERSVFVFLQAREKMKEISDLRCQESVYLTKARILFKPDFSFIENGIKIFAEAKGFCTAEYNIKRRLWKFYGEGPLEVYKGTANNFVLSETIIPE
jgi:predicted nuclease of restriction endonuclease-like RecB superfamily